MTLGQMDIGGVKVKSENVVTIAPGSSAIGYWRDVWHFRELVYFLTWRDLLIRYKQTVVGVAWSILKPVSTMIAFSVVFGSFARIPSNGVPYPLLVFAALLPWHFFASCLSESGNSLLMNAHMITKIYFPRIILPVCSIFVCLVDFIISLIIFGLLLWWYGLSPDWRMLLMPLCLVHAMVVSLGIGLWLAALNVKYRDFKYVIPVIVQFGLYISPVGFMSQVVPERWRLIYALNPMVGVIDGFRWALLGERAVVNLETLGVSMLISLISLASGLVLFIKLERSFADHI